MNSMPELPSDQKASAAGRYLRPRDAAAHLGLAPQTLAKWRCAGGGPPFRKLGRRAVRYRLADLDSFASRQFTSTTAMPSRRPKGPR